MIRCSKPAMCEGVEQNIPRTSQNRDVQLYSPQGWECLWVQSCPAAGEQFCLCPRWGPAVPGGPSNLTQLWWPLPSTGSSPHPSAQLLQH